VTADLWIPLQTHPIARKLSNLIFFLYLISSHCLSM
jgi:hypothetical protein